MKMMTSMSWRDELRSQIYRQEMSGDGAKENTRADESIYYLAKLHFLYHIIYLKLHILSAGEKAPIFYSNVVKWGNRERMIFFNPLASAGPMC